MANPNAPFGFRPARHLTGGVVRYSDVYTIADAYATSLAVGDLVVRTGTGNNIAVGVDGVAGAAAIGVFGGCKYRDTLGNILYRSVWIASTPTFNAEGATALVYDDPNIVFYGRMSLAIAATDFGQFAGLVATAPSTALGVSRQAINSADITSTLDNFKLLRLLPTVGNDIGNYAQVEVVISFHELRSSGYVAV